MIVGRFRREMRSLPAVEVAVNEHLQKLLPGETRGLSQPILRLESGSRPAANAGGKVTTIDSAGSVTSKKARRAAANQS
jgi:hypothetical protein